MKKPEEMNDADLRALPDDALDEIIRQAEAKMGQIVAMALAADQRASSVGAAYGAISAGLLAAAGTLDTIEHVNLPIIAGLVVAAFCFFLSTCSCFWACRPINFYAVGNNPDSQVPAANDIHWLKRYYCREIDMRLQSNAAVLSRTGRWTLLGQAVAIGAVIAGGAAYFIAIAHPCLFSFLEART
jgi:hypothetical protein